VDHPPLTAQLAVQVIGSLFAQAASTREHIKSKWYFYESSRDAAVGAVRMVEDTQIAQLRDSVEDTLNGIKTEAAWWGGADRAQVALQAIDGYSAEATIQKVLQDTSQAVATQASSAAADVAGVALSFGWNSLPTAGRVLLVVGGIGLVVYIGSKAKALLTNAG
jgi:hypothetical protein